MSRFHRIELFGKYFITDPDDSLELTKWGCYEPYESSLLAEACKGKICVDAGAHIGYHSCLMANAGAKSVFAYEPNPFTYPYLRLNSSLYPNLHPINAGLYSEPNSKTLYLSPINSGDDALYETDNSVRVFVKLLALDNELYEADLIKIDVQGTELRILEGMEKIISRGRPLTIALEYYGDGMRAAGINGADVLAFLWAHGFELSEIKEGEKRLAPVTDFEFADREDLVHGYVNLWAERK